MQRTIPRLKREKKPSLLKSLENLSDYLKNPRVERTLANLGKRVDMDEMNRAISELRKVT